MRREWKLVVLANWLPRCSPWWSLSPMDYCKSTTPLYHLQPGSSTSPPSFLWNSRWCCAFGSWDQPKRSSQARKASWLSGHWQGVSDGSIARGASRCGLQAQVIWLQRLFPSLLLIILISILGFCGLPKVLHFLFFSFSFSILLRSSLDLLDSSQSDPCGTPCLCFLFFTSPEIFILL